MLSMLYGTSLEGPRKRAVEEEEEAGEEDSNCRRKVVCFHPTLIDWMLVKDMRESQ